MIDIPQLEVRDEIFWKIYNGIVEMLDFVEINFLNDL